MSDTLIPWIHAFKERNTRNKHALTKHTVGSMEKGHRYATKLTATLTTKPSKAKVSTLALLQRTLKALGSTEMTSSHCDVLPNYSNLTCSLLLWQLSFSSMFWENLKWTRSDTVSQHHDYGTNSQQKSISQHKSDQTLKMSHIARPGQRVQLNYQQFL